MSRVDLEGNVLNTGCFTITVCEEIGATSAREEEKVVHVVSMVIWYCVGTYICDAIISRAERMGTGGMTTVDDITLRVEPSYY